MSRRQLACKHKERKIKIENLPIDIQDIADELESLSELKHKALIHMLNDDCLPNIFMNLPNLPNEFMNLPVEERLQVEKGN